MTVFVPCFGHPYRFKTRTLSFSPLFRSLFLPNLHCLVFQLPSLMLPLSVCLSVTTLLRTLTFVIYEHRYTTWRHAQLYVYLKDSNKVGGQHEANVNLVVPGHDGGILAEFVCTCGSRGRREAACFVIG
jgi:hypothetical protein